MKYCHYEKESGKILGYYDKEIHAEIPSQAIEITDEVWQNAINNNHNCIDESGKTELKDFRSTNEIAYLESLPTHEELDKMEYQAKLIENLIELGVL